MTEPAPAMRAQLLNAEQPLILTGPPGAVSGEFHLRNDGAAKMRIAGARLRPSASAGKAAMRSRLASLVQEEGVELRRIVVRPGQSRPVPVALALDPRTPPGTYHLDLLVDDQVRAVLMHVTENVSLRISPDTLVLPNIAGGKVTKHVVFTNDGNVPVEVRTIGTVVLDDELASCRALRGALSDVGDTMTTLDEFAAALGKRFKALYDTMVLKVQNSAVTLDPGQTESVKLTITLPESLDKRARYNGYAALSTSNLTFTIVPA
jgi:hypothetical protein